MDKSEKFYLICPVLSVFVQVAECVSACGYLRRCSMNSLKKYRLWSESFRLLLQGNPSWELAGSQQNFVAYFVSKTS